MRVVLPEAIRLVELRAWVPRYQKEMLQYLARRHETTVDEVLTRELEDVACAHAEELSEALSGLRECPRMALGMPRIHFGMNSNRSGMAAEHSRMV